MYLAEDVGTPITNAAKGANDIGRLVLLATLIFVIVFGLFILVMYFVRKRLPAADRKVKRINLP